MRSGFITLSGFGALALFTYLLTLAKPHCEDSPTKTALLVITLFGQWLIFGTILYLTIPRYKIWLIALFALLGLPIMSAVWVISLWPLSIYGFAWAPFYMTFPAGYIFTLPLTFAGAALAHYLHQKMIKTEQGAAANP